VRLVARFILVTLAAANTACNPAPANSGAASSTASRPTASSSADDAAALMQTSRDWASAAARGNVDEIVSYWSDDAIVLEPDRPALVGKQAIRGMVEASMKIPKFSITWDPERAWTSKTGDVGYLIEHNRVTLADSTGKVRTMYGKAVTIWKKDASGRWKCVVDVWNNNPTERALPAGST
jgi:ketosteroid isomerase-like protein